MWRLGKFEETHAVLIFFPPHPLHLSNLYQNKSLMSAAHILMFTLSFYSQHFFVQRGVLVMRLMLGRQTMIADDNHDYDDDDDDEEEEEENDTEKDSHFDFPLKEPIHQV